MRKLWPCALFLVVLWLSDKTFAQSATPPLTDIGSLGCCGTVNAINEAGQIVGDLSGGGPDGNLPHAFIWDATHGRLHDLGTLPGHSESSARAINNAGQVVGQSAGPGVGARAFIWDATNPWDATNEMQDLGTLGGNTIVGGAGALNNAGQVVGCFDKPLDSGGFALHAFIWDAVNEMRDLGALSGQQSCALAINDSGEVAGWSFVRTESGATERHLFRWRNFVEGMQDLGTLGGSEIMPVAINQAGQIVGFGATAGDATTHAFLWDPLTGVLQDLDQAAGWAMATAINAAGQVVGVSVDSDTGAQRAFIWDLVGGMRDLGSLDGGNPFPSAINDAGQVVGFSFTASGSDHAFAWDAEHGMRDLGTLGGSYSYAVVINELGDVAGGSTTLGDAEFHGFIVTLPNTTEGANRQVRPLDVTTGSRPVTVTFENVTQAGTTSLTISGGGPPPPVGFQLGDPPTYYELTTTALFSGSIRICINYAGITFGDETVLRLFHFEDMVPDPDATPDTWVDRTEAGSPDAASDVICANVSSLSPFAIFESVVVEAPTIDDLIGDVGVLPNPARAKVALLATLRAASKAIDRGNVTAARALLRVFTIEVEILVRRGLVPEGVGADLIADAQGIAASL